MINRTLLSALAFFLTAPFLSAQENEFVPATAKDFHQQFVRSKIRNIDKEQVHETSWGGEIQYSLEMEGKSKKIYKWYEPKDGVIPKWVFEMEEVRDRLGEFLKDKNQFRNWRRMRSETLSQKIRWKDVTLTGRDRMARKAEAEGRTLGLQRNEKAPQELRKDLLWDVGGTWEITSETFHRTPAELFKLLDEAARAMGSRSIHIHVSFPRPKDPQIRLGMGSWVDRLDLAMHLRYFQRSPHAFHRDYQAPYTDSDRKNLMEMLMMQAPTEEKYHSLGVRSSHVYDSPESMPERIGFEIRGARSLWDLKVLTLLATQRLKDGRWGNESILKKGRGVEEDRLQRLIDAELRRRNRTRSDALSLDAAMDEMWVQYRGGGKRAYLDERVAIPVIDWSDSPYLSVGVKARSERAATQYVRFLTDVLIEMRNDQDSEREIDGLKYGEMVQEAARKWALAADLSGPLYKSVVFPGSDLPKLRRNAEGVVDAATSGARIRGTIMGPADSERRRNARGNVMRTVGAIDSTVRNRTRSTRP